MSAFTVREPGGRSRSAARRGLQAKKHGPRRGFYEGAYSHKARRHMKRLGLTELLDRPEHKITHTPLDRPSANPHMGQEQQGRIKAAFNRVKNFFTRKNG